MPDGLSRPLLVGGERMKQIATTPGRMGNKTHRFTYSQVRERLQPQVANLRRRANQDAGTRAREFIFRATLWPEYLAGSYFPERLIDQAGLQILGSRPARREKVTPKRVDPDAMTKSLYLSGSEDDLRRLERIISGPVPDDSSTNELWDDIRAIADLSVQTSDETLHLSENKEASESARYWECVFHRASDFAESLALFAASVESIGGRLGSSVLEIGGLGYVSAYLTQEGARQIASLNAMRSVRPMPTIRPVVPYGFRSLSSQAVSPLADPNPITEHRIAVFDGGVDPNCSVSGAATRVTDLTSSPPDADAVEHGSIVTNAILFGYVASGEKLRQPEVTVDHYRIWPPPKAESSDPDLYWILTQIRDVIRADKHRIAVLCVAPEQEVDESTPHAWTAMLDQLSQETGTLFVVAAGNGGDCAPETGLHRVQVPADMANALGVGAATTRLAESKKWDRASYSSYGPGRPGAIMQPLVLQFGGTADAPFVGITTHGMRVSTMGTSFAAPLVAHGLGGALAAVGDQQASASFLRALAVHVGDRNRPHRPMAHGFGRTLERFDSVWNCPPNEVTLLYADALTRNTPIALPLPVPTGLPDDTPLRIRFTAAFHTRVDPTDPVDYSLCAIDWTFRPHMRMYTFRQPVAGEPAREMTVDVSDEEFVEDLIDSGWTPGGQPISGALTEYKSEEEKRRTDGKWETVIQAWAQRSVVDLQSPQLEFRYLARESGTLIRGDGIPELPFALLVRVTAPEDVPLYELVRQQFQLLTPIQLDARIQV